MADGSVTVFVTRGSVIEYQLIAEDAASVWVETRLIDTADPKAKKHIRRIMHQINGAGAGESSQLRVELHTTNNLGVTPVLKKSALVNSANPIKCRVPSARYVKIRFEDPHIDYYWEIFGFDLYGKKTSRRF